MKVAETVAAGIVSVGETHNNEKQAREGENGKK